MTEYTVVFKLRIVGAGHVYYRKRTLILPFAPVVGHQFSAAKGWTATAEEVMWDHEAGVFKVYETDVDRGRSHEDTLRAAENYDDEGWEPGQ